MSETFDISCERFGGEDRVVIQQRIDLSRPPESDLRFNTVSIPSHVLADAVKALFEWQGQMILQGMRGEPVREGGECLTA